ncbi:hypothetical protein N9R80_00210 [bacterium]|nr:hypothetical protein [bacterium]
MANYNFLKEAKVWFVPTSETGVEEGLTPTRAYTGYVSSNSGSGNESSDHTNNVLICGDVYLPRAFPENHHALFYIGETHGVWVGKTRLPDGIDYFRAKFGRSNYSTASEYEELSQNSTATDSVGIDIPIADIPEFDNSVHRVCIYASPPDNQLSIWIDGRLVINIFSTGDISRWGDTSSEGYWLGGSISLQNTPFVPIAQSSNFDVKWPFNASSLALLYNAITLVNAQVPLLLDVGPTLTFNQTFTDNTYSNKSLHQPGELFKRSNIKKANPVDISFSIPAYEENDFSNLWDCIRDVKPSGDLKGFDLYIQLPNNFYRIRNAYITSSKFVIEKGKPLNLDLQAQASELLRLDTSFNWATAFNETVGRSAINNHQTTSDHLTVSLDNTSLDCIAAVSAEIQNDIQWIESQTVHNSINIDESLSPHSYWELDDLTLGYQPGGAPSQSDSTAADPGYTPSAGKRHVFIGGVTWAADRSTVTFDIHINHPPNTPAYSDLDWRLKFDNSKLAYDVSAGSSFNIDIDTNDGFAISVVSNVYSEYNENGHNRHASMDFANYLNTYPEFSNAFATSFPVKIADITLAVVGTGFTDLSMSSSYRPDAGNTHGDPNPFPQFITLTTAEVPHISINSATGAVTFDSNAQTNKDLYVFEVRSKNAAGGTRFKKQITYKPSAGLQDNTLLQTELESDYSPANSSVITLPEKYRLQERRVSGSVTQYVTDSTSHKYVQTYRTGVPVVIEAGKNSTTGFQFNLSECTFTNRNNVADAFTQSFDWKLNSIGSNTLSSIIKINNS